MVSLQRFCFYRSIGQGSYAEVFEALDTESQEAVAIKVIRRTLKESETVLIKREVEIHKRIRHQNILRLEEYFQRTNTWYLVLQYCPAGDLRKYIKNRKSGGRNQTLTQNEVGTIAASLASALRQLEQAKIAHRDIKLANILIDPNGQVKLADFGLAKVIEHDNQQQMSMAGTKATMAPEVAANLPYNSKCDVWSFGVVLYQLLFQKQPFGNNLNYVSNPITFPPSNVSREAKQLIKKCIQTDIDLRISASDICRHPWIVKFQTNKFTLPVEIYRQSPLNNYYNNKYLRTEIYKDCLNEYDYAIRRAMVQFDISLKKEISNLSRHCRQAQTLLQSMKLQPSLLGWFEQLMDVKSRQLQMMQTRIALPNNSFLFKNSEQLVLQIKHFSKLARNYSLNLTDPISDSELGKKIIHKLLTYHGTYRQTTPEYTNLWILIGAVSRILNFRTVGYTVQISYSPNLDPQIRRQLCHEKGIMSSEQFQEIRTMGGVGLKFQRVDVLEYKSVMQIPQTLDDFQTSIIPLLMVTQDYVKKNVVQL